MCKTVSIDHYLKTIYIIQHEKGVVRNIDIAAALGYAKPSVTRAVTVLKEMEYITVTGHEIRLTANGQKEALKLLEKYKTICDFLKSSVYQMRQPPMMPVKWSTTSAMKLTGT